MKFRKTNLLPIVVNAIVTIFAVILSGYISFNLAKYGLKYQGICPEDWQRPYLIHVGTGDTEKSLRIARETVAKWATLK